MSLTDPDEIGKDEDSGLDEKQVVEGGLAVLRSTKRGSGQREVKKALRFCAAAPSGGEQSRKEVNESS